MTLLLTHDDGTIRRKLLDAVEPAREVAAEDAGAENVGEYVGAVGEDAFAVTHLFESTLPGYRGWRWSVTVATADEEAPVTISEVVLMPGPDAIVAPRWVPWARRVRPGDLGVGDIFPTQPDDPRLAPAYATLDDPEAEEVTKEIGLGRVRVMSRIGREEAATRWHRGEFGPRSDMARSAPATCGTCGFYLQLAGSLRNAFGVCGNEISPADGHIVHAEFGCGAHSEVELETSSSVPVAELVYDDSLLDIEPVEIGTTETTDTEDSEPSQESQESQKSEPAVSTEATEVGAASAEAAASPRAEPDQTA
ncbi:DUF3027 domain-containing protein [Saccharomonospora azurea]|uniref:DUF3027 family protein n=1 Tax=Saccharomonospora azurea NA-128 TaxID=882081 RepID=H8G3Q3_9PSEU|nr:DUF3027 domain-containing protein [Saccharomonospora azurea]EHY89071.1 Protein of unknown function (DUF3027) [Saccharomonospora azurea NA-128]